MTSKLSGVPCGGRGPSKKKKTPFKFSKFEKSARPLRPRCVHAPPSLRFRYVLIFLTVLSASSDSRTSDMSQMCAPGS